MDNRINLIINGKRELKTVLSNLHLLLESSDKLLIYTKSGKGEFVSTVAEALHLDEKGAEAEISYVKFNEVDYDKLKTDGLRKITGVKMPESLFHTIAKAYNDAFEFIDKTEAARYVHAFTDDCKFSEDSKRYNPEAYEWFMDRFNEPFVMDSKTNPGNFAFRKYSPRFVFISPSRLTSPISFVQYESKEHFVMDRTKVKEMFDGKLNRMYISEFAIRLHDMGIVKHPTFYPDPVIETWVRRDETMPHDSDIRKLSSEYASDEKHMRETLKISINVENSVDPLVKELASVVDLLPVINGNKE